LGQTTSSIGNGFATGVSIIAAFSLLMPLLLTLQQKMRLQDILFVDSHLLGGLLIGIALPFVFSGFLMRGLTKAMLYLISEVKRQFQDIAYLFEDKARPEIKKAADELAVHSMNALTWPTLVMIVVPVCIVYFFGGVGFKILIGLIIGTYFITSTLGFFLGIMGDSLKQARHYILDGHYGGASTPTYQNILIAENFSNSYKDLLAPSLNILIKSISILSILLITILLK